MRIIMHLKHLDYHEIFDILLCYVIVVSMPCKRLLKTWEKWIGRSELCASSILKMYWIQDTTHFYFQMYAILWEFQSLFCSLHSMSPKYCEWVVQDMCAFFLFFSFNLVDFIENFWTSLLLCSSCETKCRLHALRTKKGRMFDATRLIWRPPLSMSSLHLYVCCCRSNCTSKRCDGKRMLWWWENWWGCLTYYCWGEEKRMSNKCWKSHAVHGDWMRKAQLKVFKPYAAAGLWTFWASD